MLLSNHSHRSFLPIALTSSKVGRLQIILRLYEKAGFVKAAVREKIVVMRKELK